jgi:hypothetical protein
MSIEKEFEVPPVTKRKLKYNPTCIRQPLDTKYIFIYHSEKTMERLNKAYEELENKLLFNPKENEEINRPDNIDNVL